MVTSPRIFRAGSTQRLSVSLFSVSTPWDVNATVVYNNGRGIIASDEGKFTSLSDGFLNLKVIIIIIIIVKIITYLFHEVLSR